MTLLYHPGWQEARARMAAWWNSGDIGRPAMQIRVRRAAPKEDIPAVPAPDTPVPRYTTRSLDYRVSAALRACLSTDYFGEAGPWVASGDLAPNCLALYLGCHGVEMPDTVWCQPCIEYPPAARFDYDPGNFYWQFSLEAYRRVREQGKGKFLQQFPDLIEGLDTLAAMWGTERLLPDLIDYPEWVHACLRRITDVYFHYYDILYDLIRDEVGGSVYWAWAPGRIAKFQCDFSAMVSPAMFREFMLPVLAEMTERVSYSIYHLDGPAAVRHLDALLSLPELDVVQWTPGAGVEPLWHSRWWPLYHRVLDGGKKLNIGAESKDGLLALRREFGSQCKGMLLNCQAPSAAEAEEWLKAMEC